MPRLTVTLVDGTALLSGQNNDTWQIARIVHPSKMTKLRYPYIDGQCAGVNEQNVGSIPVILYSVPEAIIVKDKAYTVAKNLTTIREYFGKDLKIGDEIHISYNKNTIFRSDVMSLGTIYWRNYSHWMTQILPSAMIYAKYCGSKPIFVSPPLLTWQRQALDIFISEYEIYEKAEDEIVYAPKVHVSSLALHITHSRLLSPGALTQLRARLPVFACGSGRRICISRTDSGVRGLRNASEIYEVMCESGFELVTLTGMTLQDQIALMQAADVIAGEHGAGLTNLMFSRGHRLIELMPKGKGSGAFPLLATICGLSTLRIYGCEPLSDVKDDSWEMDPLFLRAALSGSA